MTVEGVNYKKRNSTNSFDTLLPADQKGRVRVMFETILFDEAYTSPNNIPVFAGRLASLSRIIKIQSLSDTLTATVGNLVTTDRDGATLTTIVALTNINNTTETTYPLFNPATYNILLGEGRYWAVNLGTSEGAGAKVITLQLHYVED